MLMTSRPPAAAVIVLAALTLSACSSSSSTTSTTSAVSSTNVTTTTTGTPPGTGKPPIMIGDKNDTEQFVLGELYLLALKAQGFQVQINQNIGPDQIRLQQLQSGGKNGGIDMYPEYLNVWNTGFAGDSRHFKTWRRALTAGRRFAYLHGLELLNPTPFSDTAGLASTVTFAQENGLARISDLANVAANLTLGGPPQFQQDQRTGLPAMESVYGFSPATYKVLEIGNQYTALDQGTVQAAYVNTTDGQFTTGNYRLLADTKNVFGFGEIVPVVSAKVLQAEGPAFAATINKVSSLLTLPVIRELNALVDLAGETPAGVASRFLADHGLILQSTVVTS